MKKFSALCYHGLPLVILVFPFVWVALAGNDRALKGEAGMVELATFLFLVIAIGFCVSSLKVTRRLFRALPHICREHALHVLGPQQNVDRNRLGPLDGV